MRILPVRPDAVLVELAGLDETLALLDALQASPIAGVTEVVPAARTLLVHVEPWVCSPDALAAALVARADVKVRTRRTGGMVQIPVRYDGEDLADMAEYLKLPVDELVRRHAASVWTVAFTGFAPGFAYLTGGDPVFDVPRRSTPRTRIPAGAVALAGKFSGVYPRATPGGWQLIGTTDVQMWDLSRTTPALLQPGMRVQFVDAATEAGAALQQAYERAVAAQKGKGGVSPVMHVPENGSGSGVAVPVSAGAGVDTGTGADESSIRVGEAAFDVLATGLQALFQDAGRPGMAGQGVSASGALDRAAFRLANQLLGNAPGAPVIELLHGGFSVRARRPVTVALTGATGPLSLRDGQGRLLPAQRHQPLAMDAGDVLTVGAPERGLRTYLAVRGGFDVTPVLGSCATDTLAGVGPEPLQAGQLLRVGRQIRAAVEAPEAGSPSLEVLLPHLPEAATVPRSATATSQGDAAAVPGHEPAGQDVSADAPAGQEAFADARTTGQGESRDALQGDLQGTSGRGAGRHAIVLDITLGPRTDWFGEASVARLAQQCWQVTQQSNRVGLRLQGDVPLARAPACEGVELASEGTALGALQVPASGQPVLFLADHPLTGGYPVIGCVAPYHLDRAAQLPAGTFVRFRVVAPFRALVGQDRWAGQPGAPRTAFKMRAAIGGCTSHDGKPR